jgi:DNA-directed RNA polymerase specialized sigma24 family protein
LGSVPFEDCAEVHAALSASIDPEDAAQVSERFEQLTHVLNRLPFPVQAALFWHYRDGYTYEEIGERLAVRRNRAKKCFIKALAYCRARHECASVSI